MQGRRLPDRFSDREGFAWSQVAPGDYFKVADGEWFVMSPRGESGHVTSAVWTIVEHEDGTITVSPSIWFNKDKHGKHGWHGYLERGAWREV